MGIKGLTSWINVNLANEKYQKQIILRNQMVIIDGNNLEVQLESRANIENNSHIYGGNCREYNQTVRAFFNNLKECEIIPIVIIGGAYQAKKASELRDKCEERLDKMSHALQSLATKMSFVQIMQELDISFFQTEVEADYIISFLAKQLKCPILSTKSDFFVSGCKVISHDKCIDGFINNCISVQNRDFAEICSGRFHIEVKHLPILAILLGTEEIEESVFKPLVDELAGNILNKWKRINAILYWLSSQKCKSVNDIIYDISFGKPRRIQELVQVLYAQLTGEIYNDTISNIWTLVQDLDIVKKRNLKLTELSINQKDCDRPRAAINDEDGQYYSHYELRKWALPQWFLKQFYCGNIDPSTMKFAWNFGYYFKPQLEIKRYKSTHEIAWPIVQVLCGLIHGFKDQKISIIQWDTNFRIDIMGLEPILQLPDYGLLPNLDNLDGKSVENKRRILFETLGFSEDDADLKIWPEKMKFWIGTISYFARELCKEFSMLRVQIISTAIFVSVIENMATTAVRNSDVGSDDFDKTEIELLFIDEIRDKLDSFFSEIRGVEIEYNQVIVNQYCKYQSVLCVTHQLNLLLGCPIPPPKFYWLDSKFVHNFAARCQKFSTIEEVKNLTTNVDLRTLLEIFWNEVFNFEVDEIIEDKLVCKDEFEDANKDFGQEDAEDNEEEETFENNDNPSQNQETDDEIVKRLKELGITIF